MPRIVERGGIPNGEFIDIGSQTTLTVLESQNGIGDGGKIQGSRNEPSCITQPNEEGCIIGKEIARVNHPTVFTSFYLVFPAHKILRGLKIIKIWQVICDDDHIAQCLECQWLRPLRLHSSTTVGLDPESVFGLRLQSIYQIRLGINNSRIAVQLERPAFLVA